MQRVIFFLLFCVLASCASQKPYYNKSLMANWEAAQPQNSNEVIYSTFFIGDAGEPNLENGEPVLKFLEKKLQESSTQSTVVFLGDNIYQHGLPDSTNFEEREVAEQKLVEQLKFLKSYEGRVFFIPGNHDWAKSKAEGWQYLQNQEIFIENYLNRDENVFLPDNGCPTPIEVPLTEDVVLICIDTQWWLHPYEKPDETSDCEAKSEADFIFQLSDLIVKHEGKKIIVAGHHPLVSNGVHGGHFPLIEHLFPLERKGVYVPMPVLGSIYVAYRKFIGSVQDIPNEKYQRLKDALTKIFEKHPNLMYLCGHDHNLQYHQTHNFHHIISGSGSKESYVSHKKKATFAYSKKGFVKVNFHQNGEVWAEFWVPENEGETGTIIFKHLLFTQANYQSDSNNPPLSIDYIDSVKVTNLGNYEAGWFKALLWGKNYRKEWLEETSFPFFDITKAKGGLKIVKRGGGQATNSLRLEAEDGKQYILRSVDKQGDKALSNEFKGTFVADIVQDQTSAAYPFGALVVPKLAEAIGIYHANPTYVYLPKDDNLGKYKESFGDAVYLFEERPDDEFWEEYDNFGNAKDIKSTRKVIKKLQEDNDNQIDELFVLKNRLFDILIGDWDRHDDQWRWAEFKDKEAGTKTYRPIPRDRDQVFFDTDGVVTDIGSHKWGFPKFQGFKAKIRTVEGLNFNGRFFDRYFLTELSLEDWLAVADTLQQILSDELLEEALAVVPEEIAQHSIEEIKTKFAQRREDLQEYARLYYLFLSKAVNVLGSDKHERFEVQRLNDEETLIRIYKVKKKSREVKRKIFERVFKKSETKEIRLYGFDGVDEFILEGDVKKGIKIRVIGGEGDDTIIDSSKVRGFGKKTIVYDEKKTILEKSTETKSQLSDNQDIHLYDRREFKYNYLGPAFFFGYNPDDGIFVGGGVNIRTQGFRKLPFAARHQIKANYAIATNSYNFVYKGRFVDILGKWDLILEADIRSPNYVQNFFGLGNESQNQRKTRGINYHRVRYTQQYFEPKLRLNSNNEKHQLDFGLYLQGVEVERNPDRFIVNFGENGLDPTEDLQKTNFFGGLQLNYEFNSKDNRMNPQKGVHFKLNTARISDLNDIGGEEVNYTYLASSFSFYQKILPNIILANRVGTAINWGVYRFYQANTLGSRNNLRGFRNYRFSGDIAFYNNTDLRIKLFHISSFLFNGNFGLLAIHDIGRVWLDGENSNQWHQGFGGGLWVNPANAFLLSSSVTHSREDTIFFVRLGFLF